MKFTMTVKDNYRMRTRLQNGLYDDIFEGIPFLHLKLDHYDAYHENRLNDNAIFLRFSGSPVAFLYVWYEARGRASVLPGWIVPKHVTKTN